MVPVTWVLGPCVMVGCTRFQAALRDWYGPRARPLRICCTRDPWRVLVSEVMAQQTQIARVDEAWAAFIERYPTPSALTTAPTADVLRAWAGLGYNRRALNLRRAAAIIVAEHDGQVPAHVEELEALPGIGPYTARAVAAIAFGLPVAAVDTNVRRVVNRVLGSELPPARLQAEADAWATGGDPATWTHATMELGATVCVRPCGRTVRSAPVATWCVSAGQVELAPAGRGVEPRRSVPFERTSRWLGGAHHRGACGALDGSEWTALPERLRRP